MKMEIKQELNSFHMMQTFSGFSLILALFSGFLEMKVISFFQFVAASPEVILDLVFLSFGGALGQVFIYFTIEKFSPIVLSVVTTTRKIFTILISIVVNHHSLAIMQWGGILIVFLGITFDFYHGLKGKKEDHKKKDDVIQETEVFCQPHPQDLPK